MNPPPKKKQEVCPVCKEIMGKWGLDSGPFLDVCYNIKCPEYNKVKLLSKEV